MCIVSKWVQGWFLYDLPICFICKFQWYKPDKQPTLESLPVVQLTDTSKSFRLWEILYETNFSTCSFQQPQNILTKNFLNHKTFQIHQNVASYQRSWNWNIFFMRGKEIEECLLSLTVNTAKVLGSLPSDSHRISGGFYSYLTGGSGGNCT